MKFLFTTLFAAASLLLVSFVDLNADMVRVKGTFKSNGGAININLFDITSKKSKKIEFYRNKFEFFVPINRRYMLTVRTNRNVGKSVLINTVSKATFEKKQQFIVVVDLTKKTVGIPKEALHASSCCGIIKYSRKYSKFYYVKKTMTFDEILQQIEEEKQAEEEAKSKSE